MATALIVGAGPGLGAALGRRLATSGFTPVLAARDGARAAALAQPLGGRGEVVDAADAASVAALFARLDAAGEPPAIVIYNASARLRGASAELDPAAVAQSLAVTALGGFYVAREAVRRWLERPPGAEGRRGALGFTGASASRKGYPRSAPFAMGKFALRGLAQSLAREYHPLGIHVVHMVIDGGIATEARLREVADPNALLDPDAIAESYVAALLQPLSAWSHEVELRPYCETF
jgi:NAD(P)-dependent dehydrogenase (short-subunit alcohol dehydrogenase family)